MLEIGGITPRGQIQLLAVNPRGQDTTIPHRLEERLWPRTGLETIVAQKNSYLASTQSL